MGCYFGERDWRRRQLATKVVARLSPLDSIDQMTDVGDVENSRQIRMALTTHCAAGLPVHWLRCQRPSLTAYRATQLNTARGPDDQLPTSMAMAVDETASCTRCWHQWQRPRRHHWPDGVQQWRR